MNSSFRLEKEDLETAFNSSPTGVSIKRETLHSRSESSSSVASLSLASDDRILKSIPEEYPCDKQVLTPTNNSLKYREKKGSARSFLSI